MSSASPISNVADDILWNIFNLIASARLDFRREKSEHPLTTIRKSSHVCVRWRHLILESSSLWGGMIDMDIIRQSSEEWGSLIMSRTKEALLCVYGDVDGNHEGTRQFFNALLPSSWHRISEIDILVTSYQRFDRQIWSVFWERPAVNLEHLSVKILGKEPRPLLEPVDADQKGHLIFSNYAPKLRTFNFAELNFSPAGSWIQGLRELTLCAVHLSPAQVVEIVSRVQHLEALHILDRGSCNHPRTSFPAQLRPISLPYLRQFDFFATLQNSLALLPLLSFPGDALRDMHVIAKDRGNAPVEDIQSFMPIILTYVRKFLAFDDLTRLSIFMDHTSVDFSLQPPQLNHDYGYSTPRLRIQFTSETFPPTPTSYSRLVAALTSWPLASVKTLSLVMSELATSLTILDPDFPTFLLSFSGVETLIIADKLVRYLNTVDTFDPWVFPSLKGLQLRSCFRPQYFDHLMLFLSRKVDTGHPVQVLDISMIGPCQWEQDWSFLDCMESLKVVYKSGVVGEIREYLCGTGSPEVLNFSLSLATNEPCPMHSESRR